MAKKEVAIVTGANRGIGFEVVKGLCKRLGDLGCVYLTSRDAKKGQEAVDKLRKLGLNPQFHELDITDIRSCDRLASFIRHEHGGINILVNNAGKIFRVNETLPFAEQADQTIETNFYGTKQVCYYLFPLLLNNARVVNVSSGAGHLSRFSEKHRLFFAREDLDLQSVATFFQQFIESAKKGTHVEDGFGTSAFAISKVALAALTRIQQKQFNLEIPFRNIHVNSVYPGFINNEFTNFKGRSTEEDGAKPILFAALDTDYKGQFIWCNLKAIDWTSAKDPKVEFGTCEPPL